MWGMRTQFAGWQSRTFVNFATFHHELDLLHCLDVLGWITPHGHDVSKEAWCEPATVLDLQQLRSSNRGALDRLDPLCAMLNLISNRLYHLIRTVGDPRLWSSFQNAWRKPREIAVSACDGDVMSNRKNSRSVNPTLIRRPR